jgi:raffinose/stachyose/melibiose transport system permease protein
MNNKKLKSILLYILLIFLAIIILTPVLFIALTSVKEPKDFFGRSVFALPTKIYLKNFSDAFIKGRLYRYMLNGMFLVLVKVPMGIFIAALAAFALTRLRVKYANGIFIGFLVGMMIPIQITLIPLNVGLRTLGLINTYVGLIILYLAFGIPFGILVLRGFFRTIPQEIDESAIIDGCTKINLFLKITLPLSKSALSTLMILDGLATWNEFLLVSIFITRDDLRTVSAGILAFFSEDHTNFGLLTAGVIITIIPILILYSCFQRYFVEGMSGAIKG